MKTIIPIKLVISNDGKGNVTNALFFYRISVNGQTGNNVHSISVADVLVSETIANAFTASIAKAKQSEDIK